MSGAAEQAVGVLLHLLHSLRRAGTPEALCFSIVNETRRLTPYRQAMLLRPDGLAGSFRTVAASGTSMVDRQAPLIQWLERTARQVSAGPGGRVAHPMDPSSQEQSDLGIGRPLWLPLIAPDGGLAGVLWLDRAEPWREAEASLLGELADAQAHALWVMDGGRRAGGKDRRLLWLVLAVAIAATMAVPVQRSAMATAEIVARDAEVVAAPIDGVIRSFQVQPNQKVAAGDLLFTLEDTDLRARAEVAAKELDIARVEHRQASQGALGGRRDAPRLAALEAQIALKEIELENARQRLERTRARAGRAGVALLPDVQDYVGRPVAVGERVMLVAAPEETEARAWLAVHDAMPVEDGAAVRVFLDLDPLNPLDGTVVRINHEAEDVPGGSFAYRVVVALDASAQGRVPRIGARGTARIDGDRAPLFLYLFRRPIAALRQTIGF